jgi:cysteinyl-tRNA synthetase
VFFLTAHWRKPIDFSEETMTAARAQAETLRNALRGETRVTSDWDAFVDALEDDFNTPAALALMHDWARTGALGELRRGLDVFGLGTLAERREAPGDVVALAEARLAARAARDFTEADRLRDEIAGTGWEVRDVEAGFELVPLA